MVYCGIILIGKNRVHFELAGSLYTIGPADSLPETMQNLTFPLKLRASAINKSTKTTQDFSPSSRRVKESILKYVLFDATQKSG